MNHPLVDLHAARSRTYVREALLPVVQKRFGSQARIHEITTEHPQRRLIRYVIQVGDPEGNTSAVYQLIGKVYGSPEQARRNFTRMQQLWTHGFSRAALDGIHIPEALHVYEEAHLVVMEEVPGVPLRQLVKRMQTQVGDMGLLARAAAKLHQSAVIPGPPFGVETWLRLCNPSPETLAQLYPDLASDITYLLEAARRFEQSHKETQYTAIHGDFHLGQVHMESGHAWLLDFDQLKYGDPARDLAEVCVFLKRTARQGKKLAYMTQLRDAFLDAYFSIMPWPIAARIPLHEALIHLKRACKCHRVQDEPGWDHKMRGLIAQSVACMYAMEHRVRPVDHAGLVELYETCPGAI